MKFWICFCPSTVLSTGCGLRWERTSTPTKTFPVSLVSVVERTSTSSTPLLTSRQSSMAPSDLRSSTVVRNVQLAPGCMSLNLCGLRYVFFPQEIDETKIIIYALRICHLRNFNLRSLAHVKPTCSFHNSLLFVLDQRGSSGNQR